MSQENRSSHLELRIQEVIADLSGFSTDELKVGATFLELGFDSLFLTQLGTAIERKLSVRITFRQLFDELPSIAALAQHCDSVLPPDPPSETVTEQSEMAMTSAPATSIESGPVELEDSLEIGQIDASVGDLFARQLNLMKQQITLLRGGSLKPPAAEIAPAAKAGARAPSAGHPTAERPTAVPPTGFEPTLAATGRTPARPRSTLSGRQRRALDSLIARYSEKTAGSKERTQRFRKAHADPRTAAGFQRSYKEIVYPIWVERSKAARLWDVDGNEYIDLLNGFGPNFLGHSPPFVVDAVSRQLERGFEVGPQTPLAGEAAEMICQLTGMERTSFMCTGSEAVQAAIRIARTVTGRDKIVVFNKDYHGNFDEVLVRAANRAEKLRTLPLAPGIPMRAVEDVLVLDYGEASALELIERHARELAAVVVEPIQGRRPELQPRDFLHEVRRITAEHGVVLHFDEVITGFRCQPGGAQAYFGVEADLATYGKVVAGGMPIGVLAGRRAFMDTLDGGHWRYGDDSFPEAGVTFFAGTFVRHPLAIAAAHAALSYLIEQGPDLQRRVNERSDRFVEQINQLFQESGLRFELPNFGSQMFVRNNEPRNTAAGELTDLFFYFLREKGVHILEGFPSYMTIAHTEEDVREMVTAFGDSLEEMADGDLIPARQGSAPSIDLREVTAADFPLTPGQQEIWLACQLGEEASCAFNESDTLELVGTVDTDSLRRAVSLVVARHDAFRLCFSRTGESQRVQDSLEIEVAVVDLRADERSDTKLQRFYTRQGATPFDLERGLLIRPSILQLTEQRTLLVVYGHHLALDGWSSGVLFEEIATTYAALVQDREPELEPAASYREFQQWQQQAVDSGAAGEALAFWMRELDPVPGPLSLPVEGVRPTPKSYDGGTIKRALSEPTYIAVRRLAASCGATSFAVLLAAFKLLMARLTGSGDFAIGVSMASQALMGARSLVGHGVHLFPMRAGLSEGSFARLVNYTKDQVFSIYDHPHCSIGLLIASLDLTRNPSRAPLVDVLFNFNQSSPLRFPEARAQKHENARQYVLYDLFANILETESGLVADWDYNLSLFSAGAVQSWIEEYERLVQELAEDPEQDLQPVTLAASEPRGVSA